MNNSQQAKNGFKTFILTLVISLGVFSVFYYLTSYSAEDVSIEEHSQQNPTEEGAEVEGEQTSAFMELSNTKIETPTRTVLAGADETTQSTVPGTGITSITLAFMASLAALTSGTYLIYHNPRRLALRSFEKSTLKETDI